MDMDLGDGLFNDLGGDALLPPNDDNAFGGDELGFDIGMGNDNGDNFLGDGFDDLNMGMTNNDYVGEPGHGQDPMEIIENNDEVEDFDPDAMIRIQEQMQEKLREQEEAKKKEE
mgnify:CR=1 FL=1